MIWLKGDQHYMTTKCGRFNVTKQHCPIDGHVMYGAWVNVKPADKGKPHNPPIMLYQRHLTLQEAQAEIERYARTQS